MVKSVVAIFEAKLNQISLFFIRKFLSPLAPRHTADDDSTRASHLIGSPKQFSFCDDFVTWLSRLLFHQFSRCYNLIISPQLIKIKS